MNTLRDMLADWLLFRFTGLVHETDELEAIYALMLLRKQRYEREDAEAAAQGWLKK